MNKLRVLTLVDNLYAQGGAERIAVQLATGLDPGRFERYVCVTRPLYSAGIPEQVEAAGVRVLVLDRGSRFALGAWRPLLSLLRRERIDVVHAHKVGSNAWASALAPLAGVPALVCHEHSWSFEGEPLRRLLDRHVIARAADVLLAVSSEDRRLMHEVEGIPLRKIEVFPNGIPAPPEVEPADVRTELGLPPETPLVGAVGRLWPVKRFDLLAEATRAIVEAVPAAHVVVAGTGDEEQRLRRLAAELGVAERFHLLGLRRDVPALLRALDVAVCSSDREGSPLSVLEYMAAGLPIVATRVGGIPDIVEDGVEGLLVPRRDPAALAGAVASLLRDRSRAGELGSRARARQRRELTVEAMVARAEALYERLAGPRR